MNRGGSFNNAASNARSANRNNNTPENQNNNLGLRPAKASQGEIAKDFFPARSARDAQIRFPCREQVARGRIQLSAERATAQRYAGMPVSS